MQPFGRTIHGPKIGVSAPFLGRGLSRHLIQSPWADAYLQTKWHLDACRRLATIEMGPKLGSPQFSAHFYWRGFRLLFEEGWAGLPSNTKSPGLRPTPMPSAVFIHPAVVQQ